MPRDRLRRPSTSILGLWSVRLALALLVLVAVVAVTGGLLAPYSPLAQDATAILKGPSARHLLGTDYLGRDVLSRLIAGTRVSVEGALEAVGLGLGLGTIPGLLAALLGRWFDWVTNRIIDGLMTLPPVIFAVAVTAAFGNDLLHAMFPIGILFAPIFFRVTRAVTLQYTGAQYVEAAELFGATRARIIRTHIWRKVLPTIAVTTAQVTGLALLSVSFLNFLGIGVQPPAPTWGGVLATDLNYLSQAPWAPFAPGLLIALTVAGLNALADAVRDRTGVPATPLLPTLSSLQEARDERRPSVA